MRIRQHGAKLFFGFYLAPFFSSMAAPLWGLPSPFQRGETLLFFCKAVKSKSMHASASNKQMGLLGTSAVGIPVFPLEFPGENRRQTPNHTSHVARGGNSYNYEEMFVVSIPSDCTSLKDFDVRRFENRVFYYVSRNFPFEPAKATPSRVTFLFMRGFSKQNIRRTRVENCYRNMCTAFV